MVEFDRIVGIVNPVSSQIHQALLRIRNLREAYPGVPYEEISTTADSERTVEMIANKAEAGDVCSIAGGDGTVHDTMLALLGTQIPILPLWGGNGNEMAHMLNGRPPRGDKVHELLQRGRVALVNPIELSLAGLTTKLGACYAGFGCMAEGARIANDANYRSRPGYHIRPVRAAYEVGALGPLPFTTTPFGITTSHNQYRRVVDLSFVNGDRIAKYGRTPADLTEPGIFRMECGSSGSAPLWIGRLLMSQPVGEFIQWGENYSFNVEDDVLAHVDAETFNVPAQTGVRVSVHAEALSVVTTK